MNSLSQELEFWHFDENLMVFKDGSLGGGFKLKGFDISCITDEEINAFNRSIENMLISVPDEMKFQVFYKLTPNVNTQIFSHKDQINKKFDEYRPIVEARSKFLEKNQKDKKLTNLLSV